MERVLFPVDLAALILGVGVGLVLLLSFQRSRRVLLLDLGLTQVGATFLVIRNTLDVYERLTGGFGDWDSMPVVAVMTALGCGLYGYGIPAFAHDVAGFAITRRRLVALAGLALLYAAAGGTSTLAGFTAVPVIMLSIVQIAGTVLLAVYRRRIPRQDWRALALPLLVVVVVIILIELLMEALLVLGRSPPALANPDLVPLASYLVISVILLVYAAGVLFAPAAGFTLAVSKSFAVRFGITPREGEIIQMILQGYSNRAIGERLFISDRTVKNHVYSIYRKTGASNKVQLLNLVGKHSDTE